jgi:hypothetical protein
MYSSFGPLASMHQLQTITFCSTVVMAFLQYKTEAIPGKPLKRKVTQEETREETEETV